MLERYEAKVSRTVLRRGRASNRSFLFGAHIEPKNAEMKRFHGIVRARYWGLSKVNVQFIITAIVVNVKRLANVVGSVCYLKTC